MTQSEQNAIQDQTLEQAAKLADEFAVKRPSGPGAPPETDYHRGFADGATEYSEFIAEAIRALKSSAGKSS